MNLKQAKRIRQALRASGTDPREVRIVGTHGGTTAILHPDCGRARYQAAKKQLTTHKE